MKLNAIHGWWLLLKVCTILTYLRLIGRNFKFPKMEIIKIKVSFLPVGSLKDPFENPTLFF